jgi:hypothetical protein
VTGGLSRARHGERSEEAGTLAQWRQEAHWQAAGARIRGGAVAGAGAYGAAPR